MNSDMVVALQNGHADAVRLLLDKGTDINARDSDDTTALMHAEMSTTFYDTAARHVAPRRISALH